jgi:hypothetical protein
MLEFKHEHMGYWCLGASVSDPDLIRPVDPDPYPGGQKLPTKIENVKKFHVLLRWMFSFAGLRLLLQLRRPLWRHRDKSIANF